MTTTKRAVLYVRVSTDHQTVENQIQALTATAKQRGWKITETYQDAGISGDTGREERPGLDRMLNDAKRRKFDIVMTWAIDRLGRSSLELEKTSATLKKYKVELFIDQQNIDTTTDEGEMFFTIVGSIASFERKKIVKRIKAGIKRAQAESPEQRAKKGKKAIGRPTIDPMLKRKIIAAIDKGEGVRATARQFKVSPGTVRNIRDGNGTARTSNEAA